MKRALSFEEIKEKTALKNFSYQRFLFLRYSLAAFFFANLYWMVMLCLSGTIAWIIPASLLLFSIAPIAEHIQLYGYLEKEIGEKLKYHKNYQIIQLFVNFGLLIMMMWDSSFSLFYPFLNNYWQSKLVMAGILCLGLLLSAYTIRKIQMINRKEDKYLQYIEDFQKNNRK